MPINWEVFKNNLLSYFDSNANSKNTNNILPQVASKIASEYELAVQQGGDLNYNNPVTTYNKPGLELNIRQAFENGQRLQTTGPEQTIFGNFFSLGVIQFWTGAQLAFLIPPPPSISVVSNNVTVPGTAIPILKLGNTENKTEFIDNMIDFFKQHLQTISGITIGLVPQPSGPPIPTPFPWVGYG